MNKGPLVLGGIAAAGVLFYALSASAKKKGGSGGKGGTGGTGDEKPSPSDIEGRVEMQWIDSQFQVALAASKKCRDTQDPDECTRAAAVCRSQAAKLRSTSYSSEAVANAAAAAASSLEEASKDMDQAAHAYGSQGGGGGPSAGAGDDIGGSLGDPFEGGLDPTSAAYASWRRRFF
jgi:hypothetical protein